MAKIELNEVINAINILTEFDDSKEILTEQLSKLDLQISDLLHFLENETFNASNGYKIAKKIKNLRITRRQVLNNIHLVNLFQQNSNKLVESNNRNMLISLLSKENKKLLNAEYNYRILKKAEII